MTNISKSRDPERSELYRALLICNSTYPDDPAGLPELNGPRRDGLVLWRALTNPKIGMFLDEHVEVLSERMSTEVLGSAARFFDDATHDDVALFYFSGHAKRLAKDELVLCTRNTLSHSTSTLLSSGVPSASLSKIIERSDAKAVIVILDCCFSGSFKGAETNDSFGDLKGTGRYVLAASNAVELASDSDHGQPSPFTRAVVRGLMCAASSSDNPSGRIVDLDTLYSYVDSDLPTGGPRPWRGFDGSGTIVIARPHGQRQSLQTAPTSSATVVGQARSNNAVPAGDNPQSSITRPWLTTRRVAGDFSIADLRIWLAMSLLGLAAAACLVVAYYRWPGVYHYNYKSNRAWHTRNSHSYLALLLVVPSVSIALCSIIEGVLFLRRSRHRRSRREILQFAHTRPMGIVHRVREGCSYIAASAIVATLFGFENYGVCWIAALSFIATSAVVSVIVSLRQGDALYLAGALIYIAAAFLPSVIDVENATFGINSTPGIIEVFAGLVMVLLWWLKASRGFLLLACVVGLLPLLSDFTRSTSNEGPYVALIGLGVAVCAWALGAGQSIDQSRVAEAGIA